MAVLTALSTLNGTIISSLTQQLGYNTATKNILYPALTDALVFSEQVNPELLYSFA